MPGPCHHCSIQVEDGAANGIDGLCSTCDTAGRFCLICGWWEIGPPDDLGVDRADAATQALTADSDIITACAYPNPLVTAVTSQCAMLEKLMTASASVESGQYAVRYWNGQIQTLHEAVTKAVNWLKGFLPADSANLYGRRMRAMTVVYLAAYQQCLESQALRVVQGNPFAPLSLHDTSAVAAKHFALHNGFDIEGGRLAADVAALRHVDTIEQFLKRKMKPAVAAWLIRKDIPDADAACSVATCAFLVYLALLTVVRPWSQQTKPDTGFSPTDADNLAAGVYRQDQDITALIPDVASRATSLAARTRLKELWDALHAVPDFPPGKLFRFNTDRSDAVLDTGTLSPAQKLYLQSLQDLDSGDCPSACQKIIYEQTVANIERIVTAMAATEDFVDLCKTLEKPFDSWPFVLEPANAAVLVGTFLQRCKAGRLALQTCAVDASWIIDKRYVGVHSVYAERLPFSDLFSSCPAGQNCNDPFIGSSYGKLQIAKAKDDRKASPLNYSCWRMQKDRAAHNFLPLAYEDYDVTAAVVQTFPLAEPDPTYGAEMLVWRPELLNFCTFKVGDSGRPTRSFLALLHAISKTALLSGESRLALFNLLIPVVSKLDAPPGQLFAEGVKKGWLYKTNRPARLVDIEAHLYGDIRVDAVEVVVLPNEKKKDAKRYRVRQVVLYDYGSFVARANELDKDNTGQMWLTASMRAQPQ